MSPCGTDGTTARSSRITGVFPAFIEPLCSFFLLAPYPSPSSLFLISLVPVRSSFCTFFSILLLGAGLARASCESWAARLCCVSPEPTGLLESEAGSRESRRVAVEGGAAGLVP
ncbi:uncharacterized protein B0H18DRAFT_1048396 [Fomitopsis serialis]|uniref:uncharacterized protein n=1 Tax=Fomitopsis serialis TaxID=139415 RepID=UPI002008E579|nr:uncharacterized protein B0H18DRAFT_1048396 [Neoantrodia serialis]KAH9913497.1 hypothetical protein B0H18DRAFT_1048396 [Neoantrodia serialis]